MKDAARAVEPGTLPLAFALVSVSSRAGLASWPVLLSLSASPWVSVTFRLRNSSSSQASPLLSPSVSAWAIPPHRHRRPECFSLSALVSALGSAWPSSISIYVWPVSASRSASAFRTDWAKRRRAFLRALSFSFRRSFGRARKRQPARRTQKMFREKREAESRDAKIGRASCRERV